MGLWDFYIGIVDNDILDPVMRDNTIALGFSQKSQVIKGNVPYMGHSQCKSLA